MRRSIPFIDEAHVSKATVTRVSKRPSRLPEFTVKPSASDRPGLSTRRISFSPATLSGQTCIELIVKAISKSSSWMAGRRHWHGEGQPDQQGWSLYFERSLVPPFRATGLATGNRRRGPRASAIPTPTRKPISSTRCWFDMQQREN
jgi:hypothetical protein